MVTSELDLIPIVRLTRDIKDASKLLSRQEARYLCNSYYQIQDYRKASDNQARDLVKAGEPHAVIMWLHAQMETLEGQIARALDAWSGSQPVGVWARGIVGIGPVISAGLLAHIDIEKAPTAGHIWRFAGLDPTVKWGKGEKRPWNADLKVLCWKIGQSFMKFHNHPQDIYGKVYATRKEAEIVKNEAGDFADQAAAALAAKRIGKDTEAYKHYSQGKLPPAQIDARARRFGEKLFLSHLHDRAYREHYGQAPPLPYPITILGHAHYIAPPE